MSANLWKTATSNAFNTSLNGSVALGDTTITLTSVTGLQSPGVLVIDRQDLNGNDTPTLREYVSFTGISGSQITGVTRGLGGSSAQSHSSAAKVEECFSVIHWNDMVSALLNVLTSAGALDTTKVIAAPSTPAQGDALYYNGSAWTRLVAGTSGQFFQTQGASANPVWAGATVLQDKDFTTTAISNSAAETTIYTYSVPANTLATGKSLRLSIGGTFVNNTAGGTQTIIFKLKYGTTTIATATYNIAKVNATYAYQGRFVLAENAGNAQKGYYDVTAREPVNGGVFEANAYGTGTEDVTSTKSLTVTVTLGTADTLYTFNKEIATLELLG